RRRGSRAAGDVPHGYGSAGWVPAHRRDPDRFRAMGRRARVRGARRLGSLRRLGRRRRLSSPRPTKTKESALVAPRLAVAWSVDDVVSLVFVAREPVQSGVAVVLPPLAHQTRRPLGLRVAGGALDD